MNKVDFILGLLWSFLTILAVILQENVAWWSYALVTTLLALRHFLDAWGDS